MEILVYGYLPPNLDRISENTEKRFLLAWAAKLNSTERSLLIYLSSMFAFAHQFGPKKRNNEGHT